jgi:hypothetical protein
MVSALRTTSTRILRDIREDCASCSEFRIQARLGRLEVRLRLRRQLLKLGAPVAFIRTSARALSAGVLGELPRRPRALSAWLAPARILTERLQLLTCAFAGVRFRCDPLQADDNHGRSGRSHLSRSEGEHNGASGEHTYVLHDEYLFDLSIVTG